MPKNNRRSLSPRGYGNLLVDITGWVETARKQAGRVVNALMTTYWRIGQRIFEQEQRGSKQVVMENGWWSSLLWTLRPDSAVDSREPTSFKCASSTWLTKQSRQCLDYWINRGLSRRCLDYLILPSLCRGLTTCAVPVPGRSGHLVVSRFPTPSRMRAPQSFREKVCTLCGKRVKRPYT